MMILNVISFLWLICFNRGLNLLHRSIGLLQFGWRGVSLELSSNQRLVSSIHRYKFIMSSALNNLSLLENTDCVSISNG